MSKIIFQAKLDGFLSAPDHLMLPHTRLLLSSTFKRQLQQRTSQILISVFSQLYDLVIKPENAYHDPHTLMPRDPDTVKSLLLWYFD